MSSLKKENLNIKKNSSKYPLDKFQKKTQMFNKNGQYSQKSVMKQQRELSMK